jgi:hypothetical protein
MRTVAKGRLEDLQWNDEEGQELEGYVGGVDGRHIAGTENVEDMERKGTRA